MARPRRSTESMPPAPKPMTQRERHAELGRALQAGAIKGLAVLGVKDADVPTGIAALARLGIEIERRATAVAPLVGRRTTLTDEVYQSIIESLLEGSTLAGAAAAAGVVSSTMTEWLSRGRDTSRKRERTPLYAAFAASVDMALAKAEGVAMSRLFAGSLDDPRLAKEWLKLMYPARYAETLRLSLDDAERAAAAVARAHGLPEHFAGDVLARANEIAEAAGAGAL